MKITEAYDILNTEVPSVQLKRFIEHVGDMGDMYEFSFVGDVSTNPTNKFINLLKDFMGKFPQEKDNNLRIEYLEKMIDDGVLDYYVPIETVGDKVKFDDSVKEDGMLLVNELALYIQNNNKDIDESN